MSILLTGASGFVGTAVAQRLEEEGRDWHALVRDPEKAVARGLPRARLVQGDLLAPALLRGELLASVDAVLHVAGLVRGRPSALEALNHAATGRLAAAFEERSRGGRFILLSSLAAVGPSPNGIGSGRPYDSAGPVSCYGRSKLAGEQAVAEACSSWISLRPGVVYGPWDTDVFVLFRMAERGIMPLVGRRHRYSLVYVADLAAALLAALDAPAAALGRAYPVVHPEVLQQDVWLRKIAAQVRPAGVRPARLLPFPRLAALLSAALGEGAAMLRGRPALFGFDKYREMKQGSWVGDASLAEDALAWRAEIAHDEGFARSVAWYRRHNWL